MEIIVGNMLKWLIEKESEGNKMKCSFCLKESVVGISNNPLMAEVGLCEDHDTPENIEILKSKLSQNITNLFTQTIDDFLVNSW